ncbi:MAG: LuxR C-terminal-related transcriptional regulator [Verrucomicrobium sp.]|nr:LuxR C-terminal-related transcriptional regulator [Verrucomicrobium sp.]
MSAVPTISTAQALAQTFSGMRELGVLDRSLYDVILQRTLAQHPEYLGVWTVWEPNALDGRDLDYANAPGHDVTGRFIPLWNRASGRIQLEPNTNYDTPGTGDWYLVPTRCGRETVMDPYEFPVSGKKEFITSQVAPIFYRGKCVGAAGVDIEMDALLRPEAGELEASLQRGFLLLDSRGGIMYSSLRTRDLLTPFVGRKVTHEVPPSISRQIARLRGRSGTAELAPLRRGREALRLKHAPHPHSGLSVLIVQEEEAAESEVAGSEALTLREREVLRWMEAGKSNPEIGIILEISTHTVKRHVERILAKLGVENRYAAALACRPDSRAA